MRCLCVVCALSVRCLCAVCALSAPSRHDAPRMYELGVPVLLGEKPTARRQNLSRSPMTLPNFQPRHPVDNARVHVFWARARLADLGFALHVFSLLRTVMTPPACTLARASCGGVTPVIWARGLRPQPANAHHFLQKCKSLICASNFWNLQVLPFVALTLHPKWSHLHFFPYGPKN